MGNYSYDRYAKIRDIRGFTDYKVTKLAGIKGTATISNWKNGKYVPKDDKMRDIAQVLGVTIDFLSGKTEKIECQECGYKYNPLNESSSEEHRNVHERMELVKEKYGFYYDKDYCMENENSDIAALNDCSFSLNASDLLNSYEDYLKCTFCDDLRDNLFNCKFESFSEYAKIQIINDKHENFMSVDIFNALCEKYNIEPNYIDENAKLLSDASNNPQLMRLLAYAEKLSPEMLDMLEVQLEALVNKQDINSDKNNSIKKFSTVEEARKYISSLRSFAAFNPNEISDDALISIANTMYESKNK